MGTPGTAYLIVENAGNILIDCPPWTDEMQTFLAAQGGLQGLVITHRDQLSPHLRTWQHHYPHCTIYIHEQEAYLAPELKSTPVTDGTRLAPQLEVIWTPGYSPGSICLYWAAAGGVLLTGRHLLLSPTGELQLLRRVKTFHWFRQLASVAKLRDRFSPETLHYLAPGVHAQERTPTLLTDAWAHLQALDLEGARSQTALL